MARVDTLDHFLTDVADAIRTKTGSSSPISADAFDTEITNIPTSGGDPTDYFNGDYKDYTGSSAATFFATEYVKSSATMVPIDCTGKTSLAQLFYNCKWKTLPKVISMSSVTDMGSMYYGCENVTTIDTSGWNTSHVTKFSSLFSGCKALRNLDVTNINTSALSGSSSDSFSNLFSYCQSIETLDLSSFVLPNSGTLSRMPNLSGFFSSCYELSSLTPPPAAFKMSGSMQNLFYACRKLPEADIKAFLNKINNYEDVTSLEGTFRECYLLQDLSLDISNLNSTSTYQSCYGTFAYCKALKSISLKITGSTMFQECFQGIASWGSQRGTAQETEEVNISIEAATGTFSGTMWKMFQACCSYQGIEGGNNGTDIVLNIDFNDCNWNQTYFNNMFMYCGPRVINFKNLNILTSSTSSCNIFQSIGTVEELHVINCDFSGITNFSGFVSNSSSYLKVIDLAGMVVNNAVTNMTNAFQGNTRLELLDVRNFTFSNLTSWGSMLWNVPTTCVIVVKDDTEKAWFNTNFSTYTNVMAVAEYEAQ